MRSAPECSEGSFSRPHSPNSSESGKGEHKTEPAVSERVSPVPSERSKTAFLDLTVKSEERLGSLCQTRRLIDGVIDLTVGQRPGSQHLVQRMLPAGVQVKVELEAERSSSPAAGSGREGQGDEGDRALLQLGRSTPLNSPDSPVQPPSRADPPASRLNFTTVPSSVRTQLHANPAAPCNVIVNGTGWRPLLAPAFETHPDRNGDREAEDRPANGDLEHEALKENNCSAGEHEAGRRISVQDEKADPKAEGKTDPDSGVEEGEHAYALPLLSASGCVVIQPVPKPAADKTAILSCSITAPLSSTGSPELEPPLKRRCLRIRNQNK